MRTTLLFLLLLVVAGCGDRQDDKDAAYVTEIDAWHADREDRLHSDSGWLTLVGLHPLARGKQEIGSAASCGVRLIAKAPARAGSIDVTGAGVMFTADLDVDVYLVGSEPPVRVTSLRLSTDAEDSPTHLSVGSLEFYVIDRQRDLFVRVKDRESEVLAGFTGIERYPVEPDWRVIARLQGEPSTLRVPNVLGQQSDEPCPGVLVFELDGVEHRLAPTGDPTKGLFLVFGDATNGHDTYPGGRFLSIDPMGALGTVVLDFNRAYNPPCVFTPYATCPLPAPQNVLPIAVTAGEKTWGDGH